MILTLRGACGCSLTLTRPGPLARTARKQRSKPHASKRSESANTSEAGIGRSRLLCDSGNGWHLLYRIDLPNDDSRNGVSARRVGAAASALPDGGRRELQRFAAVQALRLMGTQRRALAMRDRGGVLPSWRKAADTIVTEQQLRALSPTPLTVQAARRKRTM